MKKRLRKKLEKLGYIAALAPANATSTRTPLGTGSKGEIYPAGPTIRALVEALELKEEEIRLMAEQFEQAIASQKEIFQRDAEIDRLRRDRDHWRYEYSRILKYSNQSSSASNPYKYLPVYTVPNPRSIVQEEAALAIDIGRMQRLVREAELASFLKRRDEEFKWPYDRDNEG